MDSNHIKVKLENSLGTLVFMLELERIRSSRLLPDLFLPSSPSSQGKRFLFVELGGLEGVSWPYYKKALGTFGKHDLNTLAIGYLKIDAEDIFDQKYLVI